MCRRIWLALILAACGDNGGVNGGDDTPANPRSIHGTMELDTRANLTRLVGAVAPAPVPPSEIRVALAWFADPTTAIGQRPWILQDVPITKISDSWPVTFELAITEPPPAGAIHYELGYSQAKFVAYRDGNNNGKLDWTPVEASAFIDTVVAYHPHLYLWFFDDGGLKLMLPGSGDLVDPSTPVTLLERSEPRASCHLLTWQPRFAFAATRHSFPDPDEGDQGPWDHETFAACTTNDHPDGTTIACQGGSPEMYQYFASWTTTTTSPFMSTTCGPVMAKCEGRRADPTAPGPWPCPCDPQRYHCVQYQLEI